MVQQCFELQWRLDRNSQRGSHAMLSSMKYTLHLYRLALSSMYRRILFLQPVAEIIAVCIEVVHVVDDRRRAIFEQRSASHVLFQSANHASDIAKESCTAGKKVVNLRSIGRSSKSPTTTVVSPPPVAARNGSNSAYSGKCKECAQGIFSSSYRRIWQRWYPWIGVLSSCISLWFEEGGNL